MNRFLDYFDDIVIVIASLLYPLILVVEIFTTGFFSRYLFLPALGVLGLANFLLRTKTNRHLPTSNKQLLIIWVTLVINLSLESQLVAVNLFQKILLTGFLISLASLAGWLFFKHTVDELPTASLGHQHQKLLTWLVTLTILTFVLVQLILSQSYIGADEGSYVYDLKLIRDGATPIKDFAARALPILYLYDVLTRLIGLSLNNLKLINAIFCGLTALGIYKIGSFVKNKEFGALALGLYLTTPLVWILNLVTTTVLIDTAILTWAGFFFIKSLHPPKVYLKLVLSAGLLSIGVLIRRVPLLFLGVLGLYLLWQIYKAKGKGGSVLKSVAFAIGGLIPLGIVLAFLSYHLGFAKAVLEVFAGNVLMKETQLGLANSVNNIILGTTLAMGVLGGSLLRNAQFGHREKRLLKLFALGPLILYGIYIFKRGFLPIYFGESLPFLTLLAAIGLFQIWARWKALVMALIILPWVTLVPAVWATRLDDVVGSGFNSQEVSDVNYLVNQAFLESSGSARVLLGGSLNWAGDNNATQFLNLSHPLMYEGEATVYKLYRAPEPEALKQLFIDAGVPVVVWDHHFDLAFPWLTDDVLNRYQKVGETKNVEVYKLKN